MRLLGAERGQAYRLIARLKAEQLITEVENGKYLLLGLATRTGARQPGSFIATQLANPAYISYWSALHFSGFTGTGAADRLCCDHQKEAPSRIPGDALSLCDDPAPQVLRLSAGTRSSDLPILIADEAKAIVDSLEQPRYAGGVPEVAKALRAALPNIEISTLVAYANQTGDKSLGSWLGLLLEKLGHPVQTDLISGKARSSLILVGRVMITTHPAGAFLSTWPMKICFPQGWADADADTNPAPCPAQSCWHAGAKTRLPPTPIAVSALPALRCADLQRGHCLAPGLWRQPLLGRSGFQRL